MLIDTTAVYGDWFGYGGISNMWKSQVTQGHDMILNMGGAIGDISWLEEGDKPIAAAAR